MADKTQEAKRKRDVAALRDIIWDQVEMIRNKDPKFDKERAELTIKAADTIISIAKTELAYAAMQGKAKKLEFFEGEDGPKQLQAPEEEATSAPVGGGQTES